MKGKLLYLHINPIDLMILLFRQLQNDNITCFSMINICFEGLVVYLNSMNLSFINSMYSNTSKYYHESYPFQMISYLLLFISNYTPTSTTSTSTTSDLIENEIYNDIYQQLDRFISLIFFIEDANSTCNICSYQVVFIILLQVIQVESCMKSITRKKFLLLICKVWNSFISNHHMKPFMNSFDEVYASIWKLICRCLLQKNLSYLDSNVIECFDMYAIFLKEGNIQNQYSLLLLQSNELIFLKEYFNNS